MRVAIVVARACASSCGGARRAGQFALRDGRGDGAARRHAARSGLVGRGARARRLSAVAIRCEPCGSRCQSVSRRRARHVFVVEEVRSPTQLAQPSRLGLERVRLERSSGYSVEHSAPDVWCRAVERQAGSAVARSAARSGRRSAVELACVGRVGHDAGQWALVRRRPCGRSGRSLVAPSGRCTVGVVPCRCGRDRIDR